MKIAWDEIAVIFIALLGVALAYDWWKARKSTAPMITTAAETHTAVTPPQTVEEYINSKYPDAM
ncbi:MAG: hypothetical protein KAV87_59060 [Desulfobacteraceae bacterium]|nr:hypothetical protein [Desulfobacteraceae bacterium]